MNALFTGTAAGLVIIFIAWMIKKIDRYSFYALTLCGIGFIYVGFTWRNTEELVISCIQAVLFLFFSYFGMKKGVVFLAIGFFLHGIWDLVFGICSSSGLVPPHYDIFCLTTDFTIGIYLLLSKFSLAWSKHSIKKVL